MASLEQISYKTGTQRLPTLSYHQTPISLPYRMCQIDKFLVHGPSSTSTAYRSELSHTANMAEGVDVPALPLVTADFALCGHMWPWLLCPLKINMQALHKLLPLCC